MKNVENFIKAITSYGGDEYPEYAQYYTEENALEFQKWLKQQEKVSGIELYRGYSFGASFYEDMMLEEGNTLVAMQLTCTDLPSFTSSIIRATNYMNEFGEVGIDDRQKVLFKVKTTGKHFVNITNLSFYPEENEYKCADDALFKVEKIERRAGFVRVTLIEQ